MKRLLSIALVLGLSACASQVGPTEGFSGGGPDQRGGNHPAEVTVEAPVTTVAEAAPTMSKAPTDAEAAYIEFAKNASYYEGETDAELAEQAKFGCEIILAAGGYDELLAVADAEYAPTAEDRMSLELMAAAYCPEVL